MAASGDGVADLLLWILQRGGAVWLEYILAERYACKIWWCVQVAVVFAGTILWGGDGWRLGLNCGFATEDGRGWVAVKMVCEVLRVSV